MATVTGPTTPTPTHSTPAVERTILNASPWIFGFNTVAHFGVTGYLANKYPDLSQKFYLPINMGVGVGSMYALKYGAQALRLASMGVLNYSFDYKILNTVRGLPKTFAISALASPLLDVTLGNIPGLQNFQMGQVENKFFSLILSLYTFYCINNSESLGAKLFSRLATRFAALTEKSAIASKGGLVGSALLLGIGLTATTDLVVDLVESTVVHFETENDNPVTEMRQRTEAEMEDLVWRQGLAEGNQSLYGRAAGGFVASITSSIVKWLGYKHQEYIASEETRNRFTRAKLGVKVELFTNFTRSIRSQITEALINSMAENPNTHEVEILWKSDWDNLDITDKIKKTILFKKTNTDKEGVLSRIKEIYNLYPNLRLFYRYDYLSQEDLLLKFPAQELEQVKEWIDEQGVLTTSSSLSDVKAEIELIDIAISETKNEYLQLEEKYRDRLLKGENLKKPEIKRYQQLFFLRLLRAKLT